MIPSCMRVVDLRLIFTPKHTTKVSSKYHPINLTKSNALFTKGHVFISP